jgi:hypothetical protein
MNFGRLVLNHLKDILFLVNIVEGYFKSQNFF